MKKGRKKVSRKKRIAKKGTVKKKIVKKVSSKKKSVKKRKSVKKKIVKKKVVKKVSLKKKSVKKKVQRAIDDEVYIGDSATGQSYDNFIADHFRRKKLSGKFLYKRPSDKLRKSNRCRITLQYFDPQTLRTSIMTHILYRRRQYDYKGWRRQIRYHLPIVVERVMETFNIRYETNYEFQKLITYELL